MKYLKLLLISVLLLGCTTEKEIISQKDRVILYALVSSAENSNINYYENYSYIEDIGDGRGYTAGLIGFTSNTGDLLEVIKEYTDLKPDNVLKKYIPALEKVLGTDSHEGLGDAFIKDWKKSCQDKEMIDAQVNIINEMYLTPAINYASEDGLSKLGIYIYYDALIVHGQGEDSDSFGGIRDSALKEKTDNEEDYLSTFLDKRTIIMKKEEAHSDLSRITAQRQFLKEKNYDLTLPLHWTMYGDEFELTEEIVEGLMKHE